MSSTPTPASTKQAFGQFVAGKRLRADLTQRQLAERLHLTESAVSKWERGVSYPDITLVVPLARALGVTEGELVNAGDDEGARRVEREARSYRAWRSALLWSFVGAYAVTILTCGIVNLSVAHTLSWFWVVLASVAIACSLTALPLLARRHGGWWALGAGLASLVVLLAVVRGMYAAGDWLPIPIAALLLATVLVFEPIWLGGVPAPWGRHRAVIALGMDTAALLLFLLVVFAVIGRLDLWVAPTLPIVAFAGLYPWGIALLVRYLPVAGLYRAAAAVAFGGVYLYCSTPVLRWLGGEQRRWLPTDLTVWHGEAIGGNVTLLVLLGALLVAAVLAVTAALRRR